MSATFPNDSVDGSTVTDVVSTPIPERVAVTTLFDESVMLRLSERFPATVGLNATPTVQLADAARLAGQLLEAIRKSVPVVRAMLAIATAEVLLFVTVTFCADDWLPTVILPKERLVGEAVKVTP